MSLLKAMATVAGMTALSRITGFIRDIFTAAILGAGPVGDAFFVALKLPNFFRRVTAEGAFSVSFVPLYSKKLEKDGAGQADFFASNLFMMMLAILSLFTVVCIAAMPLILYVTAPGFEGDPQRYDLALEFSRITFPYLLLMSLSSLLGAIVGFLSGVFGVGGGFLTTPFLIFMGIPPAVAVGTQTNQLVASSVAGSISHWRRGNVDFKVGLVMMAGGLVGSIIGIGIFTLLQWIGQVDLAISILYIVLLGGIGLMMLTEGIWSATHKKTMSEQFNKQKVSWVIARLPYKMRFPRSKLYISVFVPGGIGFIGGILASVMGIGGGFILVPAMIYILGMSTIVAAGTSLFQIIFTTGIASFLHATINGTVDLMLAVLLIVGGVIGTQLGVYMGRSIKPSHARMTLAILVLMVSLQLAYNLFVRPEELYSTVLW